MPPTLSRYDVDQIRNAIQVILTPAWQRDDVVELRALSTTKGTVSGYFDGEHQDDLIKAAVEWSGNAHGVYITLNPIRRDCLARSANRTNIYAKHTTGDNEVMRRHWLLIDTDPARPTGISATDAEHDLALQRARTIRDALTDRGWPEPIYADSGNGGHLLYRIDLPTDDGGIVQRVLKVLHAEFGDEAVSIDSKVYNPARISKLYGTLARKGDSVPGRPHRIARLIDVPNPIENVAAELLESLASSNSTASAGTPTTAPKQDFDVVGYLLAHGVEVGRSKQLPEGKTLWELKCCPWRPQELDGGPFVMQFPDGGVFAKCHHNHCEGKGWEDLRDVIDPTWREQDAKSMSGKGVSQADRLVALAMQDELFHTPDNVAYATVSVGDQHQTWRVGGDEYKLILRGRLFAQNAVAANNAIDNAIATIQAKAIFNSPVRDVHVRTARYEGKLYLDLCNDKWQAVEITDSGWAVVSDPLVRFVRHPGMLPLPTPVDGGSVDQLRQFINVTDQDWPLIISWLMAALRPVGPFPILLVNGEQGSCKSTTCRRLRSLVDPNSVPLRDVPRNGHTLMIWANNAHVIALDNLSQISTDLSNAMCRLATGGGHSERTNYSDASETLFNSVRPQMVNGIGEVATRSDFLSRSLSICLPVIPRGSRKTERELDEEFATVHASIFGALLTAASSGLKRLPEVERQHLDLPRMADFAHWMIAVETALGWPEGSFLRAMYRNECEAHETAIADSPLAQAVRSFVLHNHQFEGNCTELMKALEDFAGNDATRNERWPKDQRLLSQELRERAPNLRAVGIEVEFHDTKRPKRVTLKNARPDGGEVAMFDGSAGPQQVPLHSTAEQDDYNPYLSKPRTACFGNDPDDETLARALVTRLTRFWSAALAAPVAPLPLDAFLCDGMQVRCL
jgi:hypothetical protein